MLIRDRSAAGRLPHPGADPGQVSGRNVRWVPKFKPVSSLGIVFLWERRAWDSLGPFTAGRVGNRLYVKKPSAA